MKAQLRIENELKLLKEKHITEHDGDYSLEPEGRYWRGVRIGLEVALNILAESAPLPEARGAEEAALEIQLAVERIYANPDTSKGFGPQLRETIAAVLSKHMQHPTGWVPIETAPKDGTRILAYGGNKHQPLKVEIIHWYRGTWVPDGYTHGVVFIDHTHWQWLPAAPTAQEDEPEATQENTP